MRLLGLIGNYLEDDKQNDGDKLNCIMEEIW